GVHFAIPMMIRNGVCHQRRIHHQLTNPVALGFLLAEQIVLRPPNRGMQLSLSLGQQVRLWNWHYQILLGTCDFHGLYCEEWRPYCKVIILPMGWKIHPCSLTDPAAAR